MKSLQKRLAEQERAKSRVQKDIADQQVIFPLSVVNIYLFYLFLSVFSILYVCFGVYSLESIFFSK